MRDGSRYVFLGGLHRSGTTPLARVLGEHPEISGLSGTGVSEDEGQHLQDVYPRIRAYGGMGRFANDPAAHLTADSPLVTQANADRLVAAWSPYWDTTKRFLLEKSPSNMIMTTFLQALFPGSAMIVLIRHPIAVALAMQKWNPVVVSRTGRVRHWLQAHELLRNDAPSVQRLHVVRYEDLVDDPPARLAEIAEFLGLSVPLQPTGLRPGMSTRYQEQWDAARTGTPLRRRARVAIERRYAAAIAQYGYDIGQLTTVAAPLDRNRLFGQRPNG
jgi:Sulfotransferase family